MLSEHHGLRPIQSDEFLPPISPWTYLGGLLLSGTIGAAILLSIFVRYNVAVQAPAVVRPLGDARVVQSPLNGRVTSIEVEENQIVGQGEIIAKLDDTELQSQKRQLQEAIDQKQAQIAQVNAQINAIETQRVAEISLMNRNVRVARADLSLSHHNHQAQRITTQADVREAEAALELARVEKEKFQQLANARAVAQLEVQQKEQAFAAAQARLERVTAASNPSEAEVIMARERIAQESARGDSMLATLNQRQEQLRQQQVELQGQLNQSVEALQQLEIDVMQTAVRAPMDGVVFQLGLRNIGQVIQSGDVVAQISPQDLPLVVKAQVAPQDISQITLCHETKVEDCQTGRVALRLSTFPHADFGAIRGAVRAISPDVITPNLDGANALGSYYEVTIEPENTYLERAGQRHLLKSGMEGTADILFQEETVLTFLLRKAKLRTSFN
jgi:HlyD family type I secretion membrane fusion protein